MNRSRNTSIFVSIQNNIKIQVLNFKKNLKTVDLFTKIFYNN